jgi:hypothetical protein
LTELVFKLWQVKKEHRWCEPKETLSAPLKTADFSSEAYLIPWCGNDGGGGTVEAHLGSVYPKFYFGLLLGGGGVAAY